MKLEIPHNRINSAQLDILVSLFAEMQALRNLVVERLIQNDNLENIINVYQKDVEETKKSISIQLKAHYTGLEGTDELLKSAFKS